MKLGTQLKKFQDKEPITRKALSKATKIDVVTIRTIEEKSTGNLKRIKKLFAFFGWDMTLILSKGKGRGRKEIKIKL